MSIIVGLLVAVTASSTPRPLNASSWVSIKDYPAESLTEHAQGTVGLELAIDPAGYVSGCTVSSSSGFRSLDTATCSLIFVRGRFSAAHDAAGRPTASMYATKITWRYPDDIPTPVEPKALEIGSRAIEGGMGMSVLHVASTGIISACDPTDTVYSNQLPPPDLCRLFAVGSRFSPPAVRKGKPVRRIVTVKIDMTSVVAR
ncbi:TonB family protein [Sphingomonas hankookensis]|uniref:TonB family protein n=1 Tax=Sphingomonas hankookensis TaxID=563996 RepID=UPI003D302896